MMTYPAVSPKKRTVRQTRLEDIHIPTRRAQHEAELSRFPGASRTENCFRMMDSEAPLALLSRRPSTPKQQARNELPDYCNWCGERATELRKGYIPARFGRDLDRRSSYDARGRR